MIQFYSALYNDLGQFVIVCPHTVNLNLYLLSNDNKIIFNRYLCSHGHSTVFVLDGQPYDEHINVQLENLEPEYIHVSRNESCKDLLLMSTIVRNEDEYIIQWIEYHTLLGIDKFIIYDNSGNKDANPKPGHLLGKGKNSNLQQLLSSYVNSGRVIILDWPFEEKFQQTHQNHSIWAFKTAKYIGFFDIDEYINPQTNEFLILEILGNYFIKEKLNHIDIGGVKLANRFFYSTSHRDESQYKFLSIYYANRRFNFKRGKSFITPSNVNCYSVHEVTSGSKLIDIGHHKIYFNHYYYLNKFERGRSVFNFTRKIDKSIQRFVKMLAIKGLPIDLSKL